MLACDSQPVSPPNLLVIVLDTARPDAIGAYTEARAHTPTLDALAHTGVLFTNAHSTSAWTLPAHGSLFTGLFPSRHGAHWEGSGLSEELTTLAEILAETHETVGLSENPHIIAAKGFAQGFDRYAETWRARRGPKLPPTTLELFARWLDERDPERPFFAFVNLMTPHLPYMPPEEHRRRFIDPALQARASELTDFGESDARDVMMGRRELPPSDLQLLRELYLADLSFADERVGEAFDMLRAAGELEQSFIIVTGDHGENIGHHGLMEHQLCLYETLLRVPLILRLPGVFEGGERRDDPVQLVDLLPTVLDVFGVPEERRPHSEGRSLLGAAIPADRPIYAEYMRPEPQKRLFLKRDPGFDFSPYDRRLRSIQVGSLKLIASDRGERELYDLARDPDELHDLSAARPEDAARLAAQLDSWARNLAPRAAQPAPAIDPEARRALRELGYTD
jgi:arylsulfatase A-like enzyme